MYVKNELSWETAAKLVMAAVQNGVAKKNHVAAAVINNDGTLMAYLSDNQASLLGQQLAYRKAYTILGCHPMTGMTRNSELLKANVFTGEGAAIPYLDHISLMQGGVLITAQKGAVVLGALGVSGCVASSDDEVCAMAAIAALQDQF